MTPRRRRTPAEEQRDGFRALIRHLGSADALRFVRHFEPGEGDHTAERHQLFAGETVASLMKDIKERRRTRKH